MQILKPEVSLYNARGLHPGPQYILLGWNVVPSGYPLQVIQCLGGTFTHSMKSTKDYPDEVINFMRTHPLMYHAVYPVHRQPLVVRSNVHYKFTTVAMDQVDTAVMLLTESVTV
ncbi:unnamed protein product [Caretta caretta]